MRWVLLAVVFAVGCGGSIQIECTAKDCEAKTYEVLNKVSDELHTLGVVKHSDDLFNYLASHDTLIDLASQRPECGDEGCTEFHGHDILIETSPPIRGDNLDCEAGNSSFPHELLHVALMMEQHNPDGGHKLPNMWFVTGSVEWELYNLPLCE